MYIASHLYVLEKRESQKGLGDAWVSFHPTHVANLEW